MINDHHDPDYNSYCEGDLQASHLPSPSLCQAGASDCWAMLSFLSRFVILSILVVDIKSIVVTNTLSILVTNILSSLPSLVNRLWDSVS